MLSFSTQNIQNRQTLVSNNTDPRVATKMMDSHRPQYLTPSLDAQIEIDETLRFQLKVKEKESLPENASVSDFQSLAQEQYPFAQASTSCGQFKIVTPLRTQVRLHGKRVGVAYMQKREESGFENLQIEKSVLSDIKNQGLPVIDSFGQAFDIEKGKGRAAMLIEYIDDAVLLDTKSKSALGLLMVGALFGESIPNNEAWYMKLPQIQRNLVNKISQMSDTDSFINKVETLKSELELILDASIEKRLFVSDLQLLVDGNGRAKIIDPQDLVKLSESNRIVEKSNPHPILDEKFFCMSLYSGQNWVRKCINILDRLVQSKKLKSTLLDFVSNIHGKSSSSMTMPSCGRANPVGAAYIPATKVFSPRFRIVNQIP